MGSRREFLRLSALAASAGCVLRVPALAMGRGAMTYGVQLYMVREPAQKDLAATLKAIHDLGYAQIELYPIAYSHSPAELKKMVADSGLGAVSGHFNYDTDFEQKIEYARALGLQFMVCPMLPGKQWGTLAGFREAAAQFNAWGAKVKAAGMTFVFHNHCYEFRPMEGSTGFEELMKHTDSSLVKLEMDVYWAVQGGQDAPAFLAKYKDRVRLLHMKDRIAGAPTGFAVDASANSHMIELGHGSIDWPALLKQGYAQGIRYAFVDQDQTAGPVLESLKASRAYLKKIG